MLVCQKGQKAELVSLEVVGSLVLMVRKEQECVVCRTETCPSVVFIWLNPAIN